MSYARSPIYTRDMDKGELSDRQLEALLERLDRIVEELHRFNRPHESREELTVIAHELRNLNDSLQALAYAALGHQGPQVRRRRTGEQAIVSSPATTRAGRPRRSARPGRARRSASSPNEPSPGRRRARARTSVALPSTTSDSTRVAVQ